jgi:hypothetical protein
MVFLADMTAGLASQQGRMASLGTFTQDTSRFDYLSSFSTFAA